MAKNQQKVNLPEIISSLRKELVIARLPENSRRRSQLEKLAGNRIHTMLYADGRATESTRATGKITLTTYNRYLSKIRQALVADGDVIPNWRTQIKKAALEHPEHKLRFNAMLNVPLSTIISELITWRSELVGDRKSALLRETLKRELSPYPAIFAGLAMKGAFAEDFQHHQRAKIQQKQAALVNIDFDELVDLATSLLSAPVSDPIYAEKLAIGVSIVTGRRQIEVCAQGTFELVENEPFKLTFDGQAKAKGRGTSFVIPTLAPAKLIIDAVERLRKTALISEILTDMNAAPVSERGTVFNNKSRCLTIAAKKILNTAFSEKSGGAGWTFKDSRALYAKSAYLVYAQDRTDAGESICTEDIFYSQFLGHSDDQAKESYKAFNVTAKSGAAVITESAIADSIAKTSPSARMDGLKALAKTKGIKQNKTFVSVLDAVIAAVELNPSQCITKSWLRKDIRGGKITTLNMLFDIIDKANLTS